MSSRSARGSLKKDGIISYFLGEIYAYTLQLRMHIFNAVELSTGRLGLVEMEKIIIIFNPRVVAQQNDGQAELFT